MVNFEPNKHIGVVCLRSIGHFKIGHDVLQQNLYKD